MTAQPQVIDHAAGLTREWVRDLNRLLDWNDEPRALRLLRVTLQTLRDWLDVSEAAYFGAQLPLLVREIYYEGWRPSRARALERGRDRFLARLSEAFPSDPLKDPEEAVRAVFRLLNNHMPPGEICDVRLRLPKSIRDLWPEFA